MYEICVFDIAVSFLVVVELVRAGALIDHIRGAGSGFHADGVATNRVTPRRHLHASDLDEGRRVGLDRSRFGDRRGEDISDAIFGWTVCLVQIQPLVVFGWFGWGC